MTATTKIAVAVASGYLLGRSKKLKLAIAVGSMMAGKRLAADPQALWKQGAKFIDANPELQALQDQVRGRMMDAAKGAAITVATSRLEHLNQSLSASGGRATDALDTVAGSREDEADQEEPDEERADQEEPDEERADEEPADEEPADEEPADQERADQERAGEEPADEERAAEADGDTARAARSRRAKKRSANTAAKKSSSARNAKKTSSSRGPATKSSSRRKSSGGGER